MRFRELTSPITFGITQNIVGVDGGFSPNQISDLGLWLDANDAATFSVNSYNGEVSSWTDKSINARVFTPINAGNFFIRGRKPQWNNRPVVAFNSTANFGMACPSYNVQEDFAANRTDITVIMATHTDDNILTFGTVYYHLSSGGNGSYFRFNEPAANARWLASSGISFVQSNASYIGSPKIISTLRSGNILRAFINGVQSGSDFTSNAVPVTNVNAPMYLGASSVFGGGGLLGDLAELLIYKRTLSNAERNKIENYLARKWITGAVVS